MKLAIEIQLGKTEKQRDAGERRQPDPLQATSGHGPHAEQGQQQWNAGVDHHAQVETQAVEESLGKLRHGRGANQLAVVDQQGHAQQRVDRQ
ncbi:hypothetical protein D9M68_831860 [compost metagenome]